MKTYVLKVEMNTVTTTNLSISLLLGNVWDGGELNYLVEELYNFSRITHLPVCIFVSWKGNEQENPGLFSQQSVHNLSTKGTVPSEASGVLQGLETLDIFQSPVFEY